MINQSILLAINQSIVLAINQLIVLVINQSIVLEINQLIVLVIKQSIALKLIIVSQQPESHYEFAAYESDRSRRDIEGSAYDYDDDEVNSNQLIS